MKWHTIGKLTYSNLQVIGLMLWFIIYINYFNDLFRLNISRHVFTLAQNFVVNKHWPSHSLQCERGFGPSGDWFLSPGKGTSLCPAGWSGTRSRGGLGVTVTTPFNSTGNGTFAATIKCLYSFIYEDDSNNLSICVIPLETNEFNPFPAKRSIRKYQLSYKHLLIENVFRCFKWS